MSMLSIRARITSHFVSTVEHALVRATSALLPTPGVCGVKTCRDGSRHGTHACYCEVILARIPKVLLAVAMSNTLFAQGVDVVKVVSRSAERKVQLPGEFVPFQTVTIHAKVTGFVDRVEVDRGSVVKK